jgi:hypothetical protein
MNSSGIDYYPFNVDFFGDDKIQLIEAEFGIKGSYIAIRLLCKVYSEGYYYQWGDDECLLFAKNIGNGIVPNTVKEVLAGLIKRSFFDKGVFDTFGILTSHGIQKRYFKIAERRKKVDVKSDILLVDISEFKNVNILSENVNISNQIVNILPQSKVKKSKVNIYLSSARENRLVFESLSPLMEELLNDQSCIEDFQRTAGAPYPDIETISDKVKEFFVKLTVDGEDTKERKDAIYHFKSWYRQQAEIEKTQSQKGGKNGTETRAAHNGANNKPAKETPRDYSKRF